MTTRDSDQNMSRMDGIAVLSNQIKNLTETVDRIERTLGATVNKISTDLYIGGDGKQPVMIRLDRIERATETNRKSTETNQSELDHKSQATFQITIETRKAMFAFLGTALLAIASVLTALANAPHP